MIEPDKLEEALEAGAVSFAKWFAQFMDLNGFSHPQLVALCKVCTGGKALLHSSQIAGLRQARLKSPGPRSFVALEYLMNAIERVQSDTKTGGKSPLFGTLTPLIKDAEIMRDNEGNPATLGYLVRVFTGLEPVPVDISSPTYTEKAANSISANTGRLIRRLMIAEKGLDPIDSAGIIANSFCTDQMQRAKFVEIIKGSATWDPDEVEESFVKLSRLLREEFNYKRNPQELIEELSA